MTLIPEIRTELMATAARQAAAGRRSRRFRWRLRPHAGGFIVALGVGVALAVAIVAVVALKHRAPASSGSRAASSLMTLESKFAVLRRPQTAADRSFPANRRRHNRAGLITKLTRLAATVNAPTAGRLRVYLTVQRVPTSDFIPPNKAGSYVLSAVVIGANGRLEGGTGPLTAAAIAVPGAVGTPLVGTNPNAGVTVSIVPDGVARVVWVFSGAGYGVLHPHPVTVYPQVHDNVAVAAIVPGEGPLARAAWYGASDQLLASAGGGAQPSQRLSQIRSVNASRRRVIAPSLRAHFSLFRSVPADNPVTDWRLQTPGTEGGYVGQMGLNYWETRYVPSVTGLDGRGLWITPGARGLCISDPQAGVCGKLTSRISAGFVGGVTGAPGHQTISGLVPDGNRTVTLVLANGAHVTVPVVDHNVYEATVPGRVVAIISRNAFGRGERHSLN